MKMNGMYFKLFSERLDINIFHVLCALSGWVHFILKLTFVSYCLQHAGISSRNEAHPAVEQTMSKNRLCIVFYLSGFRHLDTVRGSVLEPKALSPNICKYSKLIQQRSQRFSSFK